MSIIRFIPTFTYLLVIYNVLVFISSEPDPMDRVLFDVRLFSGANLPIDSHTLFVLTGMVVLYLEILKSIRSSVTSIIDHTLSMLVFVTFLIEFITLPQLGTSSFLILSAMSMFDVIAGFTITIASSRRDVAIEP